MVDSNRATGEHSDRSRRMLAVIGATGVGFYALTVAALHVLDPRSIVLHGNTMSAYSLGPYGNLSKAAFVVLGLGALALAAGIRGEVSGSRTGAILVGLFSVGFVLAGVFDVDLANVEGGAPPDVSGTIHGLAGLGGFVCLIFGMMVLARAFGRDHRWRSLRVPSLLLGLAALVLFTGGFTLPNPPAVEWNDGGWIGAVEWRLFVGTLVAWLLVVAVRLHAVAYGAGQARSD
jgi:Protein of unknown function (DUF998)